MKKLLFLSFFCILSFLSYGQIYGDPINEFESQYKREWVYIGWTQQYPILNCQPSFSWSVTKSKGTNQYGQQLYKLYFRSNSRYCNGNLAATYINGMILQVNGMPVNQTKAWINFRETYQPPFFTFWYPINQQPPNIYFTWDYVNVN